MKTSVWLLASLIGLAVTVLSAPINSEDSLNSVPSLGGELAKGLGVCAILSILTLGFTGASYCIKGAINNRNNRQAIDHYFENLKKWEVEKSTMRPTVGRNQTTSVNEKAVSGFDSGSAEDTEEESEAGFSRLVHLNPKLMASIDKR
jgi:hypothetical protein